MNNLKFGVLLCGLVGVIAVFLPQVSIGGHSISVWDAHSAPSDAGGGIHVYLLMGGYALALVMGLLAVITPPMQRWHGIVALVGFALVFAKIRHGLPVDIFKGAIGAKLMGVSAYAGALLSLLSIAKPETAR